jgi:hypothetical protein
MDFEWESDNEDKFLLHPNILGYTFQRIMRKTTYVSL